MMAARCFELSILWDFRAGCRVVMMCSRYHEVFAFELAEQKMSKVIARSLTLELYVKYYQTSCFERDIGSAVFLARPTKTQSMLAPGGVLLPNCIHEKYHNTEQTCADIHIYLRVYIHTYIHTYTHTHLLMHTHVQHRHVCRSIRTAPETKVHTYSVSGRDVLHLRCGCT